MDIYSVTTHQVLDRVARHCPRALPTYLSCIAHANETGVAFFSRDRIETLLHESYTKFRNNLKLLALEDLLEWHESVGGMEVCLIDQGEE